MYLYTPGDDNPNGQQMLTVTESGLYRLIFKSRKAHAEKFQSWVFEEVLPSIRKYGTYPPPNRGLNNTDTPAPTAEQLEFMCSRAWEKAELEGKRMTWNEIAQRSGFNRVRRLAGGNNV